MFIFKTQSASEALSKGERAYNQCLRPPASLVSLWRWELKLDHISGPRTIRVGVGAKSRRFFPGRSPPRAIIHSGFPGLALAKSCQCQLPTILSSFVALLTCGKAFSFLTSTRFGGDCKRKEGGKVVGGGAPN